MLTTSYDRRDRERLMQIDRNQKVVYNRMSSTEQKHIDSKEDSNQMSKVWANDHTGTVLAQSLWDESQRK